MYFILVLLGRFRVPIAFAHSQFGFCLYYHAFCTSCVRLLYEIYYLKKNIKIQLQAKTSLQKISSYYNYQHFNYFKRLIILTLFEANSSTNFYYNVISPPPFEGLHP